MAPIPKGQRKKLQLQCEWGTCTELLTTMPALTNHLMKHAEEFIAGTLSIEQCLAAVDHTNTDEYQCQWVDCGYVTSEGSAALLRHLLFHGFHTRIKWQGNLERERCKVEKCQLECHSRNIIPEVPSSFVCSWDDCSFITNNPDYFYCHVEMHSQMAEGSHKTFPCLWTECQVKTKDKYKLRDHLRCHSQEKKFGCIQCGGLFSNRTKFFDHIYRQGILDDPNYQCSHCSKVFASERLLRDHMRHHVNHYKCPFCEMTCPAPSVLKKHITWRHSTERPFACELCNYKGKAKTDIRRHMEKHNADDAYQCDIQSCGFKSKTIYSLREHFRRKHSDLQEDRYMCHVCEERFSRGYRLTKHLKGVHNFKWPAGHVRFRYREHDDGFLRLQTVRYESIELTQQILHLDNSSQSQQLASIPEGTSEGTTPQGLDGRGGLQAQGSDRRDKAERSSEKHPARKGNAKKKNHVLPEKVSELPTKQPSSNPPFNHVTCVEDLHLGKDNSLRKIFDVTTLNTRLSAQKVNHRTGSAETQPRGSGKETPTQDSNQIGTGRNPKSRKRIRYENEAVTEQTDHQSGWNSCSSDSDADLVSPGPPVFPIEQLQCLYQSDESGGEPTPKKTRLHALQSGPGGSGTEGVTGLIADERMRSLHHRLEDDRMAVAVEAMTNLSRGLHYL